MSAVSGLASKGEKGKSKFQSLDINSLYRSSLGESAEPQQKALPRKHGMQSLGKVPSARRPPANLPSLKSEHSGQEPPVSLVPSGGAGWGAKEAEESGAASGPPATTTPHSTSASGAPTPTSSLPPSQPPVAATAAPIPMSTTKSSNSGPQEKLWSSLMSGSNAQGGPDGGPSFLAHQNPMFQQEFPSLSTEQGAKSTNSQDVQYGPGPSLRPQTEGSWIQGGMSRASPLSGGSTGGMDGRGGAMEPGKGNSGQMGGAQPPLGPGGQAMSAPLPPQLRGIIPSFMYRGNNFGPGGPPANLQMFQGNGRQRFGDQSRQQPGQRQGHPRPVEDDGLFSRPIIKEEDLKQMDEIVRDNGWATADDIDYNQKLSFSDEEGDDNTQSRPSKQSEKQDNVPRGQRGGSFSGKQAFGGNNANPPIRLNEDDEIWRERRRQQSEEVALAVERAKQRKEEEEKRFIEQREAAAKKLEMLEKKMGVLSSNKPEQQPEKEVDDKQKGVSEGPESWVKQTEEPSNRQETMQVYPIESEREVRKERPREGGHENVAFSSKFSEDLPPRFAKQKQMLMRTGGGKPGQKGTSPPPQDNTPPPLLANPVAPPPNFDQRWGLQHFTGQGRGQGRRRSSQEQDDFDDQKNRDQDKHRHSGSSDRHERERFSGGRRDGRKISEGSRGPMKDKSDEDLYGRQQSSEERSEPSDISSRDKDFGNADRMDLQQSQIDAFDEKDIGQKIKDATQPPLITDMTLKGKPQRSASDKWQSGPIQHQRQDSERSDDSRGKRGPKPDAWSRGDDSLVAKLRGDDDSRLDTASPKKDEQGKSEDDRKGSSKSRGQRGERGPRTGQSSGREGRDNRDNRENRDANWSSGGNTANAFQKTWARTGPGEGKSMDTRGKGRSSKLHPSSGGKPGKVWEDDSEHSDEEIIPKDPRVRRPKQLKDSPEEKRGTIIGGDKKQAEKLSGKSANSKEGFAPRGEPSRRGRGGGGGGGNSSRRGGVGRGIDGYGPPAKSPFGNRDENRKTDNKIGEDVNKTKLGGMVPLSNSVANAAKQNKQTTMPPRMQKSKEGSEKNNRRKGKGGKSPSRGDKPTEEQNEENWESLSDSEDDQEGRGPRKGASPRGNNFNLANSGSGNIATSKAPGAEKKNGLGSVGARTMNQGKKDTMPLTEAAKRLEKEQSALNALDISTYAAVTSLMDDQVAADPEGSQQFLSSYNYQKKKRSNSPPRERSSGRGSKGSVPFGQQPPAMQQQMGMKNAPKSGNYERPHDRSRTSKLPPRLAKQKEHNRMQKAAAGNMPHHLGADMLDMYVGHDSGHMNSWDKALNDSLRSGSPLTSCVPLMESDGVGGGMPVSQISQGEGEDNADIKLDFAFDSSELLDDKNKSRTGGHGVSSAPSSSANSTISPSTAELNLKIASVKKVWETMPTVIEHSQDEFSTSGFEQALDSSFKETSVEDNVLQSEVSYSGGQTIVTGGSYAAAPGGLSATIAGKTDPTTTSSNVCKVKPQQQQLAMSAGQSPIGHQNQLSPPPFTSSTSSQHGHLSYPTVPRSAGMDNMSCWQHTGSAAPAFGGISAIPSPPTVLFNTNQQLAQASGLYNTFQLENQRSQFSQYPPFGLNSNNAATGFSQQSLYMQQPPPPAHPPTAQGYDINPPSLSQYRLQAAAAPYGQTQHVTSNPSTVLISTTSNSLMSASVKPSSQPIGAIGSKGYQTSAPPPPPQLNMMQPSAMYIYEHPAAANLLGLSGPGFMSNSGGLVQRPNQVQNNVVPTIQAPSSYFSNSAPGQGAFYQTSNPPPHPNAAGGGLHSSNNPYATNISGFAQNTGNAGTMQGYNATQQMVAAAAAVQSFRNQGGVSAGYMKSSQQGSQDLSGRQLKSPAQEQLGASVFSNTQMNSSPKGRGNSGGGNKQPPLPSPTLGQQQNQQQQGQKFGGYPSTNAMGLQSQNLVGGRNSGPRGPSYPSPIQRPNFQNQTMPNQNRPRMPSNQQQRGKTNHTGQGGSNLLSKMDQPSVDKQLPNSNKETNGTALTPPTSTAASAVVDVKKVVEKKVPTSSPAVPSAKPVAPAPVAPPAAPPTESKEESITKEDSSSKPAQCVE